jgi:hypothetical protein
MKIYTVHSRTDTRPGADSDRNMVLVKEGFCWPAFFLGGLWALGKRLWLAALAIFAAEAGVFLLAGLLATGPALGLAAALGLMIGYIGDDLWRWTLARRGYEETGVVGGNDLAEAEMNALAEYPALAELLKEPRA